MSQPNSKIQIFIHYEPQSKGFRSAIAFQLVDDWYYGFFIGYAGGGVQQEEYFKLSKDFKTDYRQLGSVDEDECWNDGESGVQITEEDVKLLLEASDALFAEFVTEDKEDWYIPKPKALKRMKAETDENNEPVYQYKSENLQWEVVQYLSRNWCLLTDSYC